MARGQYSDEVKAAVMAALLAGQGVNEVAAAYSVPTATVRSWKSRAGIRESVAPIVSDDARGGSASCCSGISPRLSELSVPKPSSLLMPSGSKSSPPVSLRSYMGSLSTKPFVFSKLSKGPSLTKAQKAERTSVPEVAGALPGAVLPGL